VGVSIQTVSNVINSPELVKPETRSRVEAAIRAAGYRPSAAGRALRTRHAGAIGMRLHPVVDGINGEVLDRFFHAVTQAAQDQGYRINLFTAPDAPAEVENLVGAHQAGVIDGAILIDTGLNDPRPQLLTGAHLPFAAFGRPWGELSTRHSWVDVDGRAGTYQATRHLMAAGHSRIGFIGWPTSSAVGEDRRQGWLLAQAEAEPEPLQALTENQVRDGAAAAMELRARGASAVVCASDALAFGAMPVFADLIEPGQELPVIGFDNTPVARAVGLSSVEQPVEQAAAAVVAQLAEHIRQPDGFLGQGVILTPTLELRKWESMVASRPDS
jgi:DNA-binding LacI/PurR family transcriptional regulator